MSEDKLLVGSKSVKEKIKHIYMDNWKVMMLLHNCKYYVKIAKSYAHGLKGNMYFRKQNGGIKKIPKVLQLPITNRCNLKCKMCNVPHMTKQDMTISEFKNALSDKLFSKIIAVGVNGGEPFLVSNIEEYIDILLTLPKIKNINMISNGILTNRILDKLTIINEKCKKKNVKLGITFSLDGYKETHDNIRGVPGSFDKTIRTIKSIQENKDKYCQSIGIICTISNYNIYSINELLAFAELNKLPKINFQLAVAHKRLDNDNIVSNFSVLSDEYNKRLAKEFFFGQYLKTKQSNYYFIYKYLESDCKKRMIACQWADRDVTLNASGELFYCAVNSKKIGSIKDKSLYSDFFDNSNINYRKKLVCDKCDSCIHYSTDKMYISSFKDMAKYSKIRSTWFYNYLIKGRNL